MRDVINVIAEWVDAIDPVAIAMVVDMKKSAPQPPGTEMAISESGRMAGVARVPEVAATK